MNVNYRFKHSQTWSAMQIGGLVKAEDFARWVCTRHRLDRVIVETEDTYVRPNMWVVLRRVPRHYVPKKRAPQNIEEKKRPVCEDTADTDDDEFGPDPMQQRPEMPWRKKRCVPFVPSDDDFARDHVVNLYGKTIV